MGRNLQPPVGSRGGISTVARSSYLVMILVAIYTHYQNLIDRQAMRTLLGGFIRDYTSHETWRLEGAGHSKFAVTLGTPLALQLIMQGNIKDVEVEHAVPIDTIVENILSIYTNEDKVNPFLGSADLGLKIQNLAIDIADRTLLVYVTKAEHQMLPANMPDRDEIVNRFNDWRLARYVNTSLILREVPNLVEHARVYGGKVR